MADDARYAAMPEWIYKEIRAHLENQPYRQVFKVMTALNASVKMLPKEVITAGVIVAKEA